MVKLVRNIVLLIVIFFIISFYRSCASFGYSEEILYTSPQGTNAIIVKYDFVSRPAVFKKGLLRDEKIWSYPNSGFMETVHFGVEWLTENQIRLTYDDVENDEYDEEFIINIPD